MEQFHHQRSAGNTSPQPAILNETLHFRLVTSLMLKGKSRLSGAYPVAYVNVVGDSIRR